MNFLSYSPGKKNPQNSILIIPQEYVFVDVAPIAAECSTQEHDDKPFEASYEQIRSEYYKNEAE